jgi:hypothetical protein
VDAIAIGRQLAAGVGNPSRVRAAGRSLVADGLLSGFDRLRRTTDRSPSQSGEKHAMAHNHVRSTREFRTRLHGGRHRQ